MSFRWRLDSIDWKKIGKGALIAIGGAAIVFLTDTIPGLDWGAWTPLVIAGCSIGINFIRKLITEE
jgi:hypothetical protein